MSFTKRNKQGIYNAMHDDSGAKVRHVPKGARPVDHAGRHAYVREGVPAVFVNGAKVSPPVSKTKRQKARRKPKAVASDAQA